MKNILFLLLSISSFLSFSQTRNCGTMDHLNQIRQNDPTVDQRMQMEEITVQNWINNNPESSSSSIITIPVVVHVVYKTSSQNISNTAIYSQITVLNEDFRKLNADASSVPSAFSGVAADCQIEFCLAVRDPSGNTTTGITRTYTTSSSFSTNDDVKHNSSGGKDAWSTSDYLNIWVCNISGGILGYAQFPNSGASNEDGVVCDYAYFGDVGATYPYDKGRTATHEVGHWLNLRHIWGDATCGTDYVSDTPTQSTSNGGCPSFPSTSNCSGNGSNGDMFMNYMDYTYDACMYMFSSGQKTRMRATLNGSRSSLLSSIGCVPVNTPILVSSVVTNPICNGDNNGSIDLSVSGGLPPFTYSWSTGSSSQDVSSLSSGSYSVTITDAQGQLETEYYTLTDPSSLSATFIISNTSGLGMNDGSVAVSPSGGTPPYSYYWIGNSSTSPSIYNLTAGSYTSYVIDANNCYITNVLTVIDDVLIPLSVSYSVTDVTCNGGADGSVDVSVVGGSLPYSYIWSNGSSSEDLSNLSSGSYNLTVTDNSGQSDSLSVVVSEPLPLTLTYNVTNESSVGNNDASIDMTVSGGLTPYLYYWSNGQNTEDIANITAGSYTVYVGYNNWSCFVLDTVEVVVSVVSQNCTKPVPTGLYIDNIIHSQAQVHWDNMSDPLCMALKYFIQVREVGTTSWTNKLASDAGLCNFGLPTTSKMFTQLTSNTTYEYRMKAAYCNTSGTSNWTSLHYFTTADTCSNVINFTASPGPQSQKVVFTWNNLGVYSMVRIKLRVDSISNPVGSDWQMAGGFGVNYPSSTVNKWGLTAGESYRGQARTWCDPNGGLYRSSSWTPLVFWTQPSSIRILNTDTEERKLVKITDLLGREVHPEKVIDNITLFYIYSDGTVEKRIVIE